MPGFRGNCDSVTAEQYGSSKATNLYEEQQRYRSMQDLFNSYHTSLMRNGFKWILDENRKVAVEHVLSAMGPPSLKDLVTADLSFSKLELREDVRGFINHAIRLSEAFQLVYTGPPPRNEHEYRSEPRGSVVTGKNAARAARMNQVITKSSKTKISRFPYGILTNCRDSDTF